MQAQGAAEYLSLRMENPPYIDAESEVSLLCLRSPVAIQLHLSELRFPILLHHLVDTLNKHVGIVIVWITPLIFGIHLADGINGDVDHRHNLHTVRQVLHKACGGNWHHTVVGMTILASWLHVEEFDVELVHLVVFHPLLLPVGGVIGGLPMVHATVSGRRLRLVFSAAGAEEYKHN